MSARAGTPALRCRALPPPPRAPPPTRGHHPHPPPSVRSGPALRSPRRRHPALAIPCPAPAPGPSEAPGRAPSPTPGPIVLGHPPTTRSRDVCRLSASAGPPPGSEGSPQPPRGPPSRTVQKDRGVQGRGAERGRLLARWLRLRGADWHERSGAGDSCITVPPLLPLLPPLLLLLLRG